MCVLDSGLGSSQQKHVWNRLDSAAHLLSAVRAELPALVNSVTVELLTDDFGRDEAADSSISRSNLQVTVHTAHVMLS